MVSNEIRNKFLNYFEKNGHKKTESANLIPPDPSLLFTIAGMVQFKPYFLGEQAPSFSTATSSQKCLRTNDIDEVGYTKRHLTFFEMLGNFSFGDYFKEKAIYYAWDFLTNIIKLDKDKLYITVYKDDDEAAALWKKIANINDNKIYRLGEEDNFWSAGATGPCGPCSEILYDRGKEFSCKKPDCAPGCDCDRYLEVWNLVFMQYDRDENNNLKELPKKNIDTGMGLERLCSILQNKDNNFETDLLYPIINFLENKIEFKYNEKVEYDRAFRVIADHIKASCFLISEGLLPSNEGRGYVLRRLIRRAARFGKTFNIEQPFLFELVYPVANIYEETYPVLKNKLNDIAKILKIEEEKFNQTLKEGMNRLYIMIDEAKSKKQNILSGANAFMLYDTFGFPFEITKEILKEKNLNIDEDEFKKELEKRKQQSRDGAKFDNDKLNEAYEQFNKTLFIGYDNDIVQENILTIIKDDNELESISQGEKAEIIFNRTCFYGEKGGQVGDTGIIQTESGKAKVYDTIYKGNVICHLSEVIEGNIKKSQTAELIVDSRRRNLIKRHHSATHLLQSALRKIISENIMQGGSYVDDKKLRFDYTYYEKPSNKQLEEIENLINLWISNNYDVITDEMDIEQAKKTNALAFFGEKYEQKVRVVSIDNISKEFCGGTHCKETSEIGIFRITGESAVAAGLRRIEAVCSYNVYPIMKEEQKIIKRLSDELKINEKEKIISNILNLKDENKLLTKKLNTIIIGQLTEKIKTVLKEKNIAIEYIDIDIKEARKVIEKLSSYNLKGVVFLINKINNRQVLAVSVINNKELSAKKIIQDLCAKFNAKGGGNDKFSQASFEIGADLKSGIAGLNL